MTPMQRNKSLEKLFKEAKNVKPKHSLTAEEMDELNESYFSLRSLMHFTISGNNNLLSTHRTTLEFTKENYLTKKGDCILGIKATFSLDEIRQKLKKGKIKITIATKNHTDELIAEYNPAFDHQEQMVIRTSNYIDGRTFAINATKAAKDIKRELVEALQHEDGVAKVTIEVKV